MRVQAGRPRPSYRLERTSILGASDNAKTLAARLHRAQATSVWQLDRSSCGCRTRRCDQDPHSRRLPPRSGAGGEGRCRYHRLRGRAGAHRSQERRAMKRLASARRRWDAPQSFAYAIATARRRIAERLPEISIPKLNKELIQFSRDFHRGVHGNGQGQPDLDRGCRDATSVADPTTRCQRRFYEIDYEAGNRPDWIDIPIEGVLGILDYVSEAGMTQAQHEPDAMSALTQAGARSPVDAVERGAVSMRSVSGIARRPLCECLAPTRYLLAFGTSGPSCNLTPSRSRRSGFL